MIAAGLDVERLAAFCGAELERWATPGVEVVAIKGDEVVFAGGFGRRRLDPDLPVTEHTVFAHGSTGKGFTAFLVGTLVDAGILAWDAPVRDYVPDLRIPDPALEDRVTIRDLLTHRSGLGRHDLAWICNPTWTRREFVGRLRHLPLSADLRQAFHYSNFGYVLAGHVVEVVTGSTFEDQLQERVFGPLGFERTYVSTAVALALEDHADPHRVLAGKPVSIPARPLEAASPAGGIWSCATDTARWLRLQLGDGAIDGRRVLSETNFKLTHTAWIPMPAQPAGDFELAGYAMGWCLGTYRGRRMVWHNGGVDGFYTEFMLLPDDGIAVGTCNNAGEAISQVVARHVVDELLQVESRDWGAELKELDAKGEAAAAESQPQPVAGTSPSHPLADYAGTFVHPGYGDLRFELRDGELRATLGEVELRASWRHYDTWDLRLATLSDHAISATFYTDPAGAVSEVFLPLEPAVEPIRFRRRTGD